MTDGVSIRLLQPGEEEEACALVARVFGEYVAPDFPRAGIEEFLRYAHPEAMAARSQAGHRVLVAEEGNRLLGVLELRDLQHISMLFVEARGKGVGGKLLQRSLRMCRTGLPGVRNVTVNASRYGVPFYRRFGFEAESAVQFENGMTFLPMALRLQED